MREEDIRRIIAEVIRYLTEKGYIRNIDVGGPIQIPRSGDREPDLPSRSRKKGQEGPPAVTIGTAGKVFSENLVGGFLKSGRDAPLPGGPAQRAGPLEPAESPLEDGEHTDSSSCPVCSPLSNLTEGQVSALGADRVCVCNPTKTCSTIARIIDHTLLKSNATQEEIGKLCQEARDYCFASVCVNPGYVSQAVCLLKGSGVKVCTVVGFPLGATTPTVKCIEARDAIANGADEIDMVVNVGALKSGNDELVFEDIKAVREATRGRVLKVIIETAYLNDEEKVRACNLSKRAGADYVKTSTGFGPGGATVEDIRLMRETVGPGMGIKASGGIRDSETARAMVEAGATRIGASASVAIVS